MILSINSQNPQPQLIQKVAHVLDNNGVIIFPTDTTYAFGCNIHSKKAIKQIYLLKEIDKKKPLTFICNKTQQFQQYTQGISNPIYKIIRNQLPGPYTFIFEASKLIPKTLLSPRKTIGVKIPNSKITQEIINIINIPILSSSVPLENLESFQQDPYEIYEKYKKQVDLVIDAGEIFVKKSAIIDFTVMPPEIIRKGDANLNWLN